MKTLLFILCFSCFFYFSFAQKQANNWFFGSNAGISFASGSPVSISVGQIFTVEGNATISDENGNLLFYTDGKTIWNKLHMVMQNGTGLFGDGGSTQSAIIVPQSGNDSIYYVFTADDEAGPNGICYSIINVNRSNKLGEVIQKNIQLLSPASEKLTAVKHCNNKDIWLLARGWNNDKYYAWLVSSSGINSVPVVSATGNSISGNTSLTIGYMKVSPDGKKIAAAYFTPGSFTEIGDFNNQTGVITNIKRVPAFPPGREIYYPVGQAGTYGLEFSPDAKKLYTSVAYFPFGGNPYMLFDTWFIYQMDISVSDSVVIHNSMYRVDSATAIQAGSLQLGPDNKIYLSQGPNNYLSVISNPNNAGSGCNFQRNVVTLDDGSGLGLPTFIQSYFGNNTYNYTFANNCTSQSVNFQINNTQGYSSIKWVFDDPASGVNNTAAIPNPIHNFTAAGIYKVKLIVNKNNNACAIPDTINKEIWVGNVNTFLGIDTTICEKDSITLNATAPNGVNYLWSNTTTGNSIRVTNPGNYWLRITAGACIYSDTIKIAQQSLPRFTLGNDASICANDSIILQPTTLIPNGNYLWSTNAITNSIKVKNAATYWLRAKDNLGCTWRDTILVTAKQLPNFNLGKDTSICELQTLLLNTQIPNAGYLWSTGSLSQSVTVSNSGIYWVDVTKDGCTYRDSIELTVKPLPLVNLGTDSTLCEGQFLDLNAFNTGAAYFWQDNSAQSNYRVTKAGEYHVRVTLNGCVKSDTIKVVYNLKPRFTLGADRTICPGEIILLQPSPNNIINTKYLWQNGDTLFSLAATQPGLYILKLTNSCGITADSIVLKESTCKVFVPNTFTPNGDRYNQLFRVLNVENIKEFSLRIFDRWGNLIFETVDKYKGWNGTRNGIEQPVGLFTYTINYSEKNTGLSVFRKGTVQLIR